MTRMRQAQRRLRDRLRASAGRKGTVSNNGTPLYNGDELTFVPTEYRSIVKSMESDETEAKVHVWLVGRDEMTADPTNGDEYLIEQERYRVVRDEVMGVYWMPHGPSDQQRAIFTHKWS